ncbi:2-(S)-hydroxypropyl-CoM dehydrogenase [Microthyrium microscopicum]|uniref:2-(S)-hydroxypropyl-CoM dehydrogenase n=1 Tax=Microthyrium microscopicum TaxID=703497 RepID=A0A6A6UQN8_9PEZI|nr:2-(S)-hydroxypropyl-CoM dehydrogenase [Microthyrium microscopicum]
MTSTISARPSRSLKGYVAIVTGAGSADEGIGNGRASAILLAEAGCSVVCVDLSATYAEKTASMIEADRTGSQSAIALSANVTDELQCKSIVQSTVEKYGRLDILVNNVGIMGAKGTAETVDMAEWDVGMRVNVSSMVMMAKYAIPEMKKNDNAKGWRGAIVNMGSITGLMGGAPSLLYPTSKGAVMNLTRSMANHHAPDGIRVNCVCPGMLYTPMTYGFGMTEEMRKTRREQSLLKTEGTGWDCGAAVRFLACDEARWITGTTLTVDAGLTSSIAIVVEPKQMNELKQ